MSAQASYLRIGLFVLLSLMLIVIGIVVLGAGAVMKKTIPIETYFNESVQGLDVGAPIKYRGVEIGRVSSIGFVHEWYPLDTAERDVKYGKYVMVVAQLDPDKFPRSTEAGRGPLKLLRERVAAGLRIRLQASLTGPASLEADYVAPDIYKPVQIGWEPRFNYIPSAPGTMSQMVSAVERLASQIEQAPIAQMVDNLNTTAVTVNKLLDCPEAKRTLAGLAVASENAGPALLELLKTVRSVNNMLTAQQDDISQVVVNLRKATGNMADLSEDAKNNPSRLLLGAPPLRVKTGGSK